MRAEQAKLELLCQLLGDLLGDEAAEARVDAVGVLVRPMRCVLDHRAGGAHARARIVGQRRGRPAVDRDGPHVAEREVLTCQRVRHGHMASLEA